MICGDSLDILKMIPDNCIDSIVTDPPYEINFMSKKWDGTGIAYNIDLWSECLRVLKPGGHLLSFGSPRTCHRMTCAIEDAGFEIIDQIQWIYASGMPKGINIEKQLIKIAPRSIEAEKYKGWSSRLKPSHEPITMAKKALSKSTIAKNVLEWGTGGINIDECRVGKRETQQFTGKKQGTVNTYGNYNYEKSSVPLPEGRFPSNVILDEESGKLLDLQSGTLTSGVNCVRTKERRFLEHGGVGHAGDVQTTYGDSGGASRFFYCAKASPSERNGSHHPTIKPIALMRYLVRLVTPPDGIVLDPFAGTGTTLKAAQLEGFNYTGIEKQSEYIPDIIAKLAKNVT